MLDEKVWQEFLCHVCCWYTRFKLNMGWNRIIKYKCRHCGTEHKRFIKDGQLQEKGREGEAVEELVVPPSACTEEPMHTRLAQAAKRNKYQASRDAQVFEKPTDVADQFLRERWLELYGGDA